jgi:opacity protein-like surface antigen/outer membrane protease
LGRTVRSWTCSLVALTIPLAVIGLPPSAGAEDYLRGSMAPSYPLADAPLLPDNATLAPAYPLADPAPPQVAGWTGFYLGGTLSFGAGTFTAKTATSANGPYFPNSTVVSAVNRAGDQPITPFKAAAPGLTAGYNWQFDNLVLGVEADIQGMQLSGGALAGPLAYPGFAPLSFAIGSAASANWLLTARSRFGWAMDDILVYGTAGAAVTTINAQFAFADIFGTAESAIVSTTRLGFAAGGGVEVALWDNWTAKAEYLYVYFSPVSVTTNLLVFPAIPVPGQAFTHSVDLAASLVRLGLNYRFGVPMTEGVVGMPVKAEPMAPAWSWTGLYIGGQMGAAASTANFSDPFGTSVFFDTVRSPGFLVGGQVGFNWQPEATRWVFGIEADANRIDSDGTATCFAVSLIAINATCRVSPQATATLTGRIGYALDPLGRTLVYGKAGAAWASSTVDMALGNAFAGFVGPDIASVGTSFTAWGWTLGVGIEYALTPAWSMKLEYDYLALRSHDVPNLGSSSFDPFTASLLSATPPGTSSLTQNLQMVKMGVNYRWDGGAQFAYAAEPVLPAWQVEAGLRYFAGWGQFHKDIGNFTSSGLPSISSVSRLTYNDMQTLAGEFFGRADLPWNLFVKGYIGGGAIKAGHMNDEDFGIPLLGTYAAYSNTLSPGVNGSVWYGVADAGFDFLRGPRYKLGGFAGFFYFSPEMNAFGCTPIANVNCIPSVATAGDPAITELDHWRALRIGLAGEAMVADRLKLAGEVAYLPYATFEGVDQHFFGNSGFLASNNPESGNARGVQIEVLLSYYVAPNLSLGVGGRYWGMWTTNGQVTRTIDNGAPIATSPTQFFKGVTEQVGAFVQAAYCFGPESF